MEGFNPKEASDELFAWNLAERFVEMDQAGGVHTQRGNNLDPFFERVDQRRGVRWRNDGARMSVERDDHRHAVVLKRVGNGLPDHLLMSQVDAIKDPDGHADLARTGF